jgi:hypothetical protein
MAKKTTFWFSFAKSTHANLRFSRTFDAALLNLSTPGGADLSGRFARNLARGRKEGAGRVRARPEGQVTEPDRVLPLWARV